MKKIILFTCVFSILSSFQVFANTEIIKETYTYSIKENDTLRLDKYTLPGTVTEKQPCIVFMFGGGFFTGSRDADHSLEYLNQMAKEGYVVISIDYRLGLKDIPKKIEQGGKVGVREFPVLLNDAITLAVEDLYTATNYILEKSDDWNINDSLIIISGSSAGAISVLQGEYTICSNNERAKVLPNDFRYAGVIAFAGAIFSTNGNLKWAKNPAPIQFFHGNADSNVPYDKLKILKLGFFGPKYITKQLDELKSPYYFYDIDNADHKIAVTPLTENLPEIKRFIQQYILEKKPLAIHSEVQTIGKPEMKKKFGIKDYIKANFSGGE